MSGAGQALLSTDTGSDVINFTTGFQESSGLLFNGLGSFYGCGLLLFCRLP
jgi:hypothetical protein